MATTKTKATKVAVPKSVSKTDIHQLAAERVAELKVQITSLKAELAPLEELLRDQAGSEWETDHGIVAAIPVETVSLNPDALREHVGVRKFNSDFRSDAVDPAKWRNLRHTIGDGWIVSQTETVKVSVRIAGPKVRKGK